MPATNAVPTPKRDSDIPSRVRAAVELIVVFSLLHLLLWWSGGPELEWLRFAAMAGIVLVVGASALRRRHRRSRTVEREPPTRWSPVRAWTTALAVTGLAAAGLAALFGFLEIWSPSGSLPHSLERSLRSPGWWGGKFWAVTAQQLSLHYYVFPLCLEVVGRMAPALLLAGGLFGAAHAPNTLLALLAGCAAPVWCALYLRGGRILPLVVCHVAIAIVARVVCGDAIYHMRVGASVVPMLTRTLEADDGEALRVTPRALEGFVDRCRTGAAEVVCAGWATDVDDRSPVGEIAILAGGRFHRYPLTGGLRPDVVDHFRVPELLESGFEVKLPPAWFAAAREVRFFAVSRRGQATELQYADGYRSDL